MPLHPLRISAYVGFESLGFRALVFIPLALLIGGFPTYAQTPAAGAAKPGVAKAQSPESISKPGWSKLTPAQQVALMPLVSAWSGISEGQKRKWIALSQNYLALSDTERITLHGRMTEWAALSPEQRSQARLNFAQTKQLSTEEKKTQWKAYQALSTEQKKQLASGAHPKAIGAAPAVTPSASNKLAAVPITRSEPHNPAGAASRPRAFVSPRIAGAASRPVAQP